MSNNVVPICKQPQLNRNMNDQTTSALDRHCVDNAQHMPTTGIGR